MAVDTPPTAYLVACTDTGYGDVVPLIPTIRYSLGRAPTNRIHLRDDLCSREHAEIYCHEGNWFLRDLGSLNGCHLNETKVETEQPLRPEDRVRMGTSRFLFAETLNQLPTPDFPTPSATSNIAIRTRLAETRYLPSQRVADDRTKVVAPQRLPASDAVQILFQLAVDSATAATPQALADFVLDGLFRATQAEVAAILAITPNRSLEPFAYRTRNPQMKTYHKVSHFVSTEVLNTKQAVLAEDVASEPSLKNRESLSDLRAASLICAPVLADNDVQGLVHLYSGTANRRLNADDLDVVLAIARQFGIVWQRLKREAELSAEVRSLKDRLKLESSLIGQSAAIRKIEDQIARVAAARTTVLVRGESGVGKELVAHAIHFPVRGVIVRSFA